MLEEMIELVKDILDVLKDTIEAVSVLSGERGVWTAEERIMWARNSIQDIEDKINDANKEEE